MEKEDGFYAILFIFDIAFYQQVELFLGKWVCTIIVFHVN